MFFTGTKCRFEKRNNCLVCGKLEHTKTEGAAERASVERAGVTAHPCSLVQASTRDSDVSHRHVVDGLLGLGYASLPLETEEHYQGAHHAASQLKMKEP